MVEVAPKELSIIKESYTPTTTSYPGCVDGRAPMSFELADGEAIEGNYPQLLGGSFHMAAARWVLDEAVTNFDESRARTYKILNENGVKCGGHDDEHCQHGEMCGCGFCQNFRAIMARLGSQKDEIWRILIEAHRPLADMSTAWDEMHARLARMKFDDVPAGKQLVKEIVTNNGSLQVLEGEHQEVAACVNLKPGTSLDVQALNARKLMAFNLDLHEALRQAKILGIDEDLMTVFSLGAYVATEMVLVEDKGKPRLPIYVHQ